MESRLLSHGRAGQRDWMTNSRLVSLAEGDKHAGESMAREQEAFRNRAQRWRQMLWQGTGYKNWESCCERKGAERKQNSWELRCGGVRAPGGVKRAGVLAVEGKAVLKHTAVKLGLEKWRVKGARGRLQPFLSARGGSEEWLPWSQSWDACSSPWLWTVEALGCISMSY